MEKITQVTELVSILRVQKYTRVFIDSDGEYGFEYVVRDYIPEDFEDMTIRTKRLADLVMVTCIKMDDIVDFDHMGDVIIKMVAK